MMTALHLTLQSGNHTIDRSTISSSWRNRVNISLRRGLLVVLSAIATGVLLEFHTPAQAQAEFGNFGITTPSERFRSEGQNRIEQEIHRLQSPPEAENLLIVDENIQEQLLQLEDPRFRLESPPTEKPSDALNMSEVQERR